MAPPVANGVELWPMLGSRQRFTLGARPRHLNGTMSGMMSARARRWPLPGQAGTLRHRRGDVKEFEIRPDPDDPRLSVAVDGIDHEGRALSTAVVAERPLTLFLNAREIVTMMTIGDRPDLLAVGYLLNQNML